MIWLIGCKGMLGTELSNLLEKTNLPFVGTDREVDITNKKALNEFINGKNINYVINCAAYTAVDKAEDDIQTCNNLNNLGAANIASCSSEIKAKFIHISTDYVFDGKGFIPYKEDDITNPIGVYGKSKRDGEISVLENNPNSYIIRTAWLYGKYGNNFISTMIRLMNERDEIKVVNDQRGSPTWAYDLVNIIINFINADRPYGIYHYTNEGDITWFDFAKEIYNLGRELNLIKKNCLVSPCTSEEFPSKVTRPSFSVLDKSKIKSTLGINIPLWNNSLKEYLKCLDC